MTSPDRSIAVVFNGAIYNFLDLRAELVARGFLFQSATDTEVLIHGYAFWGIDGLVARLRVCSLSDYGTIARASYIWCGIALE